MTGAVLDRPGTQRVRARRRGSPRGASECDARGSARDRQHRVPRMSRADDIYARGRRGRAPTAPAAAATSARATALVRLVRADLALMDAALAGDEALSEALGHAVVPGWVTFTRRWAHPRRAGRRRRRRDWGTRFFVVGDPPELVGWGGFKGPPRDGVVELGYEIAESRPGAGSPPRRPGRWWRRRSRTSGSRGDRSHPAGAATPPTGCSRRRASASRRGGGGRRARLALRACTRRRCRRSALELTVAGQAAAGRSERQPALRGKSGHRRAGWSGDRPGESRGKVPQKQTADGAASAESRTGKGEKVR